MSGSEKSEGPQRVETSLLPLSKGDIQQESAAPFNQHSWSHLGLLGHLQCVIHFDAEIPHCAFQFGVAE